MKRFLLPAMAMLAIASLVTAQCAVLPVATAGGNGQTGYMFDIENLSANAVTVTGFDVRGLGNYATTINLYTLNVTGSFTALAVNTTTAANWTLVGSGPLTLSTAANTALPFAVAVTIPALTKQAVYITTSVAATNLSYTTGLAGTYGTAVIATDGVLNVYAGAGKAQLAGGLPFGGTFGGPTVGVSGSRNFRGAITYQTGALASWEANSAESSLDFNGANGTPCSKALSTVCAGGAVNTTLASNIPGTFFDVAFNLSATVGNGAGALATAGGQLVNLDLLGGLFMLNGTLVPHPGTLAIAFGAPAGLTISAQQVVVDPTHVDGINLSQAAQLDGVAGGGVGLVGPAGDDTVMTIVAGGSPLCAPALTFYGTTQTTYHVVTNGRLMWPVGSNSWTPSAAAAQATTGTLGIWTDYNTAIGGNVTIDIVGGVLGVNFNAIGYFGQAGTASTFRLENDTNTGIVKIANIAQGAQAVGGAQSAFLGMSPGIGATDPLQAAFSPAAVGVTTNATDMLYNFGLCGTLAPGITSITFVPNGFSNYDWSSL